MSVRSLARNNLRARAIHGAVLLVYVGLSTQVSGDASLVAWGAVALAALASVVSFVAEVAVLSDVARDDGDALLTTGERLNLRSLDRVQRASRWEAGLLALTSVPVAVALAATTSLPIAVSGATLAGLVGLFELLLVLMTSQNSKSRDAFVALREWRPTDAIAVLQDQDLRPAARWNDALLLAEAWVMVGAGDRALEVISPHLAQQAVAVRDAAWRLEADPSVARALLAQAPRATKLEALRRDELEVLLCVREGCGAEVLARLPELRATFPTLPDAYTDVLRIGLAGAANQAGRPEEARELVAGLTRPLASYAFHRHTWPSVWRWVDPAGVVQVPPALARVEAPVGDAFAPPRVDPPTRSLFRTQLEGVQPVPSLPVGIRRSPVRRAFSLIASASSLALIVPVLAMTPAVWLLGSDPVLAELMGTLLVVVGALVAIGLVAVASEWLRSRPVPPEGALIVHEDGSVVSLGGFRHLGVAALVERVVLMGFVASAAFVMLGYGGAIALPVLALLWNSQRPHARGRALTLAMLEGDDHRAAALCAKWLRAWVVVPKTRAAVEVHQALVRARLGDVAGARAAVAHTDGVAEARWCRAWLTADTLDARALDGVLADDRFGWWRVSAVAVGAIAAGRPVDEPALEGLATTLRNRFGEVLWVLLAMARGRERGRALLEEKRVDVTRCAWMAVLWPGLASKFGALV